MKKKAKATKTAQRFVGKLHSIDIHIKGLALGNRDAYIKWCEKNGFRASVDKTQREKDKELAFVKNNAFNITLDASHKFRNPERIISGILNNNLPKNIILPLQMKAFATEFKNCFVPSVSATTLIQWLATFPKSFLYEVSPYSKVYYIRAIMKIASKSEFWVQSPETWKPTTHNHEKQFTSLVNHLFAKYPVPNFMTHAWFTLEYDNIDPVARFYPDWYIHIGSGQNIRTVSHLQLPLTKKMAHCFLQAPDYYTIPQALRFGQAMALGADFRIANLICHSKLTDYKKLIEPFWESVIRFFVNNPMCPADQVGPIVDYIENQKYIPQRVQVERGRFEDRPPVQPNFSMKGRTIQALLANVDRWHHDLGKSKQRGNLEWERSKIKEFTKEEGTKAANGNKGNWKTWRIFELLSSQELKLEGRQMSNCVASYDRNCHAGRCSIWSLMTENEYGEKTKYATIEVSSQKMITQARRPRNEKISPQVRNILHQWASQNNLTLATYL